MRLRQSRDRSSVESRDESRLDAETRQNAGTDESRALAETSKSAGRNESRESRQFQRKSSETERNSRQSRAS